MTERISSVPSAEPAQDPPAPASQGSAIRAAAVPGDGDEPARLASVAFYRSTFRPQDAGLLVLTRAAMTMLQMPMAWITLVDEDSQLLLAATGAVPEPDAIGRDFFLGAKAICRADQPLLVPDTRLDAQFSGSAIGDGPLAIRFYVGMPLLGREKLPVGTFCVLDVVPRRLGSSKLETLRHLASAAAGILESHRSEAERHEQALDAGRSGVPLKWHCRSDGLIHATDAGPAQTAGIMPVLTHGTDWITVVHPMQQDMIRSRWHEASRRLVPFEDDFRTHDRDGLIRWLRVTLLPCVGDDRDGGTDGLWHGSLRSIDQLGTSQSTVMNAATHDVLTGLANRHRFQTLLDRAVQDARLGIPFALLYLDLDDFKSVNDTFGHEAGDRLLQETARRLTRCVRRTDVVCRLGGDEFVVIQAGLDRPSDVAQLAQRIVETLCRPMPFDGHSIDTGVSIGIALGPRDGTTGALLLSHADLALYRAKQDGRGGLRFFNPTMDAAVIQRSSVKRDLRHALDRCEFFVDYQPILSLQNCRVAGFEALLRWRHPLRGIIPPSEFVPIAEAAGLIVPIGAWVLRTACETAMLWPPDVRVAVNLSPRQFAGCDIAAVVSQVVAETGLAPKRLELEITETLPLLNNDRNLVMLRRLRSLGVRMVLDDFGTGYSSLAYLSTFRFDSLKLDRSLIAAMKRRDGLSIARAIIKLAADLGITVTAEGIETARQLQQVIGEGCTQAQGYHIARPMDPRFASPALTRIAARLQPACLPQQAGPRSAAEPAIGARPEP